MQNLTRREAITLAGLTLAGHTTARQPMRSFGQAKACILLFPYGSPPQHEMFDPKPDAPAEIQGEMKSIPTCLPGVRIGEGIPALAPIMDRLAVVRSVTHPYPEHGVAYAVTGIPTYTPALEDKPRDARHWPFIGSVVDYIEELRSAGSVPEVPRNVGLPWLLNSKTDLNVSAGPYAAFLGQAHDPVWAEFDGPGLKIAPRYTDSQTRSFLDPFQETTLEGRFRVSTLGLKNDDFSAQRLQERCELLRRLDRVPARAFGKHRELAFSLLTSGKMLQSLDLSREPRSLRERYGRTLFGQSCLAARRLIEAGSKFVTVFWDGFGQFANCAWDTHNNHYPRLKDYLLPGFNQAYPALIYDLESRGLLDSTLVLWLSEHGRTPKIDSKPKGAGRHHWSRAYSVVLAGGGAAQGKVIGSTDKHAGEVKDMPVSPKDLLATAFHLLGIDANTTVPDSLGRPMPIAGDGRVRHELLA
ncbi:MAG: DUF1501 domain-containing protein [Planctomycetia bacterium]|nr:DUF1501 domain-containing protein [Planctomycetia bacterium]